MRQIVVGMLIVALVAVSTAALWADTQRAAMHRQGTHASPLYCRVMDVLHYPGFEKGEIWACGLVMDGLVSAR